METLYRKSFNRISKTPVNFKRYIFDKIEWNDRLICVTGARGSGKTTLFLQHIKQNLAKDATVLYISLDDLYFTENKLSNVVEDFYNRGGRFLFIDEVHKYKNWSIEIKNIYDTYTDLKVAITGSSMLEINEGKVDLSRRMSVYHLHNLSYREFLEFEKGIVFPKTELSTLLKSHIEIAYTVTETIGPLTHFAAYLQYGCLPFYKENKDQYPLRLNNIINITLESDIAIAESIDFEHLKKLKLLMYVISQSVPFSPNIVKLAEKIEIDRRTVIKYLELLQRAEMITLLTDAQKGVSVLAKPQKIYLANTNIAYSLANSTANIGNIRETFFLNQLRAIANVNYTPVGDFNVNKQYIFEVGGKNKDFTQIRNIADSYLACDDITTGLGNKIPLWLFGFLY